MAKRRPLPPRQRWPRRMQGPGTRRACSKCGTLDRVVSTRGTISYYGPAKCDKCKAERGLRKAERPIDWAALAVRYVIPIELLKSLPSEVVTTIRAARLSCSHGCNQEEAEQEAGQQTDYEFEAA